MLCEPLLILFVYEVLVCGCFFPTFPACIFIQHKMFGFVIKPLLTTIHCVVLLLQETEPLFLWKILFTIKYFRKTEK